MAQLNICSAKIIENIKILNDFMAKYDKKWTLISKVLSGNKKILNEIIKSGNLSGIHSIGDSRISSLRAVKELNPDVITMYIKPPAINYAQEIIEVADISMNTSIETLVVLNEAASRRNKIHKAIIMIEMGELREGILHENVIDFYSNVFELPNIEIVGLGTNLGCMYGIEPTFDKLLQLSLYKQLIDIKFNQNLNLISGGTSITLPLIEKGKVPKEINHFRIGESAFLGVSPLNNERFLELHTDAFNVEATIVEIEEKEYLPEGIISDGNVGHTGDNSSHDEGTSSKALVDFGILDVNIENIESNDEDVSFIGTTSDITVFDLGDNKNPDGSTKYKVGDSISFSPSYMGVARLMSSKFVDKTIFCQDD
ncbi:MAG: alanine racemase [Candidatus Kapabacteria bacterium]|nr:alanine racemase [Ignavibacteriota bacterium]MCW5884720.1 alanine racemase [Candidatus Kapabacteria bacterium]